MPITDTLTQALLETRKRIVDTRAAIAATEADLQDLRGTLQESTLEESVLTSIIAKSGMSVPIESTSPESENESRSESPTLNGLASGEVPANDWSTVNRIEAVNDAVAYLTLKDGVATPGAIQDFLGQRNRIEKRDNIGAALSYLRKQGRVKNVDRGQWIPRTVEVFTS